MTRMHGLRLLASLHWQLNVLLRTFGKSVKQFSGSMSCMFPCWPECVLARWTCRLGMESLLPCHHGRRCSGLRECWLLCPLAIAARSRVSPEGACEGWLLCPWAAAARSSAGLWL